MKDRYQVLVDGEAPKNFDTKKEARDYIRDCKKAGKKADFWDTMDNPLSKFFKL